MFTGDTVVTKGEASYYPWRREDLLQDFGIVGVAGRTNMEAIFETNPVFLSGLLGDLKTGKI